MPLSLVMNLKENSKFVVTLARQDCIPTQARSSLVIHKSHGNL
ncbi:MAG: hypothetical protein ABFS56_32195 [Pseudomonadota bacterium]